MNGGGPSGPPFPMEAPMMLKFIGEYTNGRTSISYLGCTFEGHAPREVTPEVMALLKGHPEFQEIHPLDHDGNGRKGGRKRRAG
jgi:hypothetical protein